MKHRKNENDYRGKLMEEDTPFAVREAFRALRANLTYTATGERRVFGITSARAEAGKSVLIANLALSFAEMKKKVLLIDADMRRPSQHFIFGISAGHKGISEYLAGITREPEACIAATENEYLSVMPCGRIPPNPAELLAAGADALLLSMAERYDYVFVDLPPIGEVADATILAKALSGFLLVVRIGTDHASELRDAEVALKQTGASICGIVLNDTPAKRGKYYHYRYRYAEDEEFSAGKETK